MVEKTRRSLGGASTESKPKKGEPFAALTSLMETIEEGAKGAREELDRFTEGGVKVASTRARKHLKTVKDACMALRKAIQGARNEGA